MTLDPSAVGTAASPYERSWTSTEALLYAVGVGAGTGELAFTTENTSSLEQRVLPTFAVVIDRGGMAVLPSAGEYDPTQLVHGRQAVTLHRTIPVEGTASVTERIAAMHDKQTAAVVVTEAVARIEGEVLYNSRSSVFIRGAGGWGGEKGPSGPQNTPPHRPADHSVVLPTLPSQALLYRLSGDRNPLHSDPDFARRGGFERPILHGLCTFGFTGRALLHQLCNSDPGQFRHMEARFTAPVYPGDELTLQIWEMSAEAAVFTTSVGDRVVLDEGLLRHS